jgi:hypothetical protein
LQEILGYRNRLERGYAAEDEAFKWLQEKCISGSQRALEIFFAECNDDGYDIVIRGQLPGNKNLQCFIEVKGISKDSETSFIYLSKNEYLKMLASLGTTSDYDYVILIVDEVTCTTDPTQKQGRVCGYCDAKSLLSKLSGWATPEFNVIYDVDSTEFRICLQALKKKGILFKPDELFVRILKLISKVI